MPTNHLAGVFAPVVTPFDRDLAPDARRFTAHCHWLLDQGCGLAVFGTNSEANSQSVEERMMLLEHLAEAGIDMGRAMPGTGCCSLSDTVRLTAHAVALGAAGVLTLPPFYYKTVSDEGLFRYFAEVIERVADARLRIYLYHIPPVAQVGISLALIERLIARYPDTVAGIKDSSGQWSNTQAMIEAFPGFSVFAGSEDFLLQTLRAGGAGCISATANVNPAAIRRLFETWRADEADEEQRRLSATRAIFQQFAMIPALKAAIAHFRAEPQWRVVRPPLVGLAPEEAARLAEDLAASGFSMPGIEAQPV